jgi:DNA-binding NarL/FixJ family response regulator
MTLLIVDDHPLIRVGPPRAARAPRSTSRRSSRPLTGREALEIAAREQPDIVLLDVSMPGLNGVDTARRLTTELPACKVIMLSMHCHEERVAECLRAGAVGYLVKDGAVSEIMAAIEARSTERCTSARVSRPQSGRSCSESRMSAVHFSCSARVSVRFSS